MQSNQLQVAVIARIPLLPQGQHFDLFQISLALPFFSSFKDGEGFNYEAASAEYWLVEIAGLAFGLTSDMLRYSGMVNQVRLTYLTLHGK